MKKIICLILVLCTMVASSLSLFSCTPQNGNNGNTDVGDNNSQIGDSTTEDKNPDSDKPDVNDPLDDPTPDNPTPDNPTPDNPTPDNPTPDDPNPDDPNPDDPTPDDPTPDDPNPDDPNPDNPTPDNPTPDDPVDEDCLDGKHVDNNSDNYCDLCSKYVIVVVDFYVLNDLHGKFCDTATQPGVDEIGTYIENSKDDNVILLSAGDMWQGSAESTLSKGKIMVEWMNALGFAAMTLGNHEFDWGEGAIRENLEYADFPFLAINIYDKKTGKLADYCTPSIMIDLGDIQIGVIGAIGDCYSSISSDKVTNVEFKLGSQLNSLIQAESNKLRADGADFVVLSYHADTSEYTNSLSNGYIDLVFEGHTHSEYVTKDTYGVYHLQSGGENNGICHVEISINSVTGTKKVNTAKVVRNSSYGSLDDHMPTEEVEDNYTDIIDYAYSDLGVVSKTYGDTEIEQLVAELYLEAGLEKWDDKYDIVLAGGFIRTRDPYDLSAGIKKYADIVSLFPFDNQLVLCKVSGSNLKNKFINSTSSDYYVALSSYGSGLSISNSGTYYIVVDTYTALYAPNGLTMVEYYDEITFARDLLAKAIKEGRLEISHDGYKLTSIPDALAVGNKLSGGQSTSELYYIKGKVKSSPQATYGNLYLVDENGNEIYVYGLYDQFGNRYDSMSEKPKAGDTIIVYSTIYKYSYGGTVTVELKNATLIDINP